MSSFRNFAAGLIVGMGTMAGASGAQAAVTEYEWTGTIVDPGALGSSHGVSANDTIVGSFFYDNSTPGGPPGPGGGGGKSFVNAISSHSFSVGSFSGTFTGMMVATFDNLAPTQDQLDIRCPCTSYTGSNVGGTVPRQIFWVLKDTGGTTLLNDSTLPVDLDLADWPGPVFSSRIDFPGLASVSFSIDTLTTAGPLNVEIDIKPGSDENSINLDSNGVIPVAILGSADFDATAVDGSSCRLGDAEVKMAGKSDNLLCTEKDVNDDGYLDLVCKFVTIPLVVGAVDTEATVRCDSPEAIEGTDSINLVPAD